MFINSLTRNEELSEGNTTFVVPLSANISKNEPEIQWLGKQSVWREKESIIWSIEKQDIMEHKPIAHVTHGVFLADQLSLV
jgi:hypothetical protein